MQAMTEEEELNRELRRALLFFRLADVLKYLDTAEAALDHTQEQASDDYDKIVADDPSFDRNNYIAFLEEERGNRLFRTMPFMLWGSAFIQICAIFEHEITRIAQERHAMRNGEGSKNPGFMRRFSDFDEISDDLKLDFPDIKASDDWQEIDHYKRTAALDGTSW
jgi:hypothetical protein